MSIITVYLIFSMLAVLYFDMTRFIIPNWLVGSLLVLYPVALWLSPVPVDWKMAALGMLIVFAVGYVIFSLKWMGGGDIKLLTACALWVGWNALLDLVVITALLGGLLSIALMMLRKWLPLLVKREKPWPRILRPGEPVAYGLAIATTFLILLYLGRIPMLPSIG